MYGTGDNSHLQQRVGIRQVGASSAHNAIAAWHTKTHQWLVVGSVLIARAKATRELLYVFKAVSLKWSMKRSASWKYAEALHPHLCHTCAYLRDHMHVLAESARRTAFVALGKQRLGGCHVGFGARAPRRVPQPMQAPNGPIPRSSDLVHTNQHLSDVDSASHGRG